MARLPIVHIPLHYIESSVISVVKYQSNVVNISYVLCVPEYCLNCNVELSNARNTILCDLGPFHNDHNSYL